MPTAIPEPQAIERLLKRAARAERRLLKRQEQAERRLAKARDRLQRAEERLRASQERVEKRTAAVANAEEQLRQRQAERAAGPPPAGAPPRSTPAEHDIPRDAPVAKEEMAEPEAPATSDGPGR